MLTEKHFELSFPCYKRVEDEEVSQTNFFVEDELADKRHIGIPDHGGVQRILQTGVVAPSLDTGNPNDLRDKFDIIFTTYYIEPSRVRAIRPEDKKCIEEYRQKATEGEVDSACSLWKKFLGFDSCL